MKTDANEDTQNRINHVPLLLYHVTTTHAYSITDWAFKANSPSSSTKDGEVLTADQSRARTRAGADHNAEYNLSLFAVSDVASNQYRRFCFLKTKSVDRAVICILYVWKLKLSLRSTSMSKSFTLSYSRCLATIAFILVICLL